MQHTPTYSDNTVYIAHPSPSFDEVSFEHLEVDEAAAARLDRAIDDTLFVLRVVHNLGFEVL